MKISFIILLSILFCHLNGLAQNTNFTVTDCSNAKYSSLDILNEGYVLIIASTGIDCSACQSVAQTVGGFSSNNTSRIKIWGAMNFRYSNNTPTCVELFDWRNNYFWNDILMFVDNADAWEGDGYPTYYVIEPETKKIILETVIFSDAANTAAAVADTAEVSTVVTNFTDNSYWNIFNYNNILHISSENQAFLQLIDLYGNVQLEEIITNTKMPFQKNLQHLQKGMYIVQIKTRENSLIQQKKIIVY